MLHTITTPSRRKLTRLLAKVGLTAPTDCADGFYRVNSAAGKEAGLVIEQGASCVQARIYTGADLADFAATVEA